MANIFADTVGDFGRQLQARRAAQAQAMNQAANNSARFAFEAQRVQQEQANRRTSLVAAAMDQRNQQARAQQNFQFQQAQAQQSQQARAQQAAKEFEFRADQAGLDRTASSQSDARKFAFAQANTQRSNASRLAASTAGNGSLGVPGNPDFEGLVQYYVQTIGVTPEVARVQAMNHAQQALENYRRDVASREPRVQTAFEELQRANDLKDRGDRDSDDVMRAKAETLVPVTHLPRFLDPSLSEGNGGGSSAPPPPPATGVFTQAQLAEILAAFGR